MVFAHVNFLNLLTDDPEDTGIAESTSQDGCRRNSNRAWDTLQLFWAPTLALGCPNVPRANPHGCSEKSGDAALVACATRLIH